MCIEEAEALAPKQPPRDPLLQLVSLQKASGCWLLDAALASALGKTSEEVEKSKPGPVGRCQKIFFLNSSLMEVITQKTVEY